MAKSTRFGVIFSGGTAAGMNVTLEFLSRFCDAEGAELIGFKYGWTGLIKNDIVNITMSSTLGIGLEAGGTYLGSCSKVNVFDHNGKDYSKICYETYKSRRLDGIFVLGGDGTNRQANEMNKKYPDMKFIWISATLDRDVVGCDDTIGFHTAVENSAQVIVSMANDSVTMKRHSITECMGRHTGFVALYGTLEANRIKHNAVDMLLVPEVQFDLDAICNRISQATEPLNIVISEGIILPELEKETNPAHPNASEGSDTSVVTIVGHHRDLANTCKKLAAILEKHSKLPIKTAIVGYMQRTGHLSTADTFLAEHCAKLAVTEALKSTVSMAIIFQESAFKAIPMSKLVEINEQRGNSKQEAFLADPAIKAIPDALSAAAFREI